MLWLLSHWMSNSTFLAATQSWSLVSRFKSNYFFNPTVRQWLNHITLMLKSFCIILMPEVEIAYLLTYLLTYLSTYLLPCLLACLLAYFKTDHFLNLTSSFQFAIEILYQFAYAPWPLLVNGVWFPQYSRIDILHK